MDPRAIKQSVTSKGTLHFQIGDGWCEGWTERSNDHAMLEIWWTDGIIEQGVRVDDNEDKVQDVIHWLDACYQAEEAGIAQPVKPTFIVDSDWLE